MLLAARAARKQLLLFKPKLPLSLKPLLNPSSSLPHFTLYSFQYPNPNNPFPTPRNFSSKAKKITNFRRDGNFDETTSCNLPICPGCGVNMQESNPKLPGYSIKPSPKNPDYKPPIDRRAVAEELEISFSLKTGVLQELVEPETPPKTDHKPVVCVQCHSLRHYGEVKDSSVGTKIDLLPPSLSPTRWEHWVRQRAREGGANKFTSVHLVSAVRDWGLKNLVDDVCALAGARGNVWAIGTQNAGKSTLINSIGKHAAGKMWIAKAEYDESGPSIVHGKCF